MQIPARMMSIRDEPILVPPRVDQVEVSLFGPGFGEAIALHLGNGSWFLIDSCQQSSQPAPLSYLERIGVDIRSAVIGVLATHWHTDHVLGISRLFHAASNARFFCSR